MRLCFMLEPREEGLPLVSLISDVLLKDIDLEICKDAIFALSPTADCKYATLRLIAGQVESVNLYKNTAFITNSVDMQYKQLVEDVFSLGSTQKDRTGVGTTSIFGVMSKYYNVDEIFPLLTSKFVSLKSVAAELKWFLKGSSNNHDLNALGCTIWDEWDQDELFQEDLIEKYSMEWDAWPNKTNNDGEAFRDYLKSIGKKTTSGDLGPVYGKQWRSWPTKDGGSIDQIKEVLSNLINKPHSRRHIVTGWNPEFLPNESDSHEVNIANGKQVLPPCHLLFQFNVSESTSYGHEHVKVLNCMLYQRSADIALGVPYNIASYALLLLLFARFCNYKAGCFTHVLGDAHIYTNHQETLSEQVSQQVSWVDVGYPKLPCPVLTPHVEIHPDIKTFDDFLNWPDDKPWYTLTNYQHLGKYSYEVAV